MANTKISAATDAGTLVGTDRVPLARSGSTTAYSTTIDGVKSYVAIAPYTSLPFMDGAPNAGSNAAYSRGDHVHPPDTSKLSLSGGTMTGPLTLAADATAALQAVTKQQLDALTTAAGYAPLASPTFTGNPTAPTPASGDNDTSLATTQFVQSAVAPYANDAGRNLLHNGRFEVQQRGAGAFTIGYTADRWKLDVNLDTNSLTLAAASDTTRSLIGDESVNYFLSDVVTGNAGAAAYSIVSQRLEDVRRFANRTVTVSFWASMNSGTAKIGVSLDQFFGTGGSPSPTANGNGQAVTVTNTWQRFTLTFVAPSVAGKTLGASNDHCTIMQLWLSAGSNYATRSAIGVQSGTFNIWGVQLEVGSVATPLSRRDPADELALCQRFYQTGQCVHLGYTGSSVGVGQTMSLSVTMRVTPTTVTFVDNGNGNITSFAVTPLTAGNLWFHGTATSAGGWTINVNFTASADL